MERMLSVRKHGRARPLLFILSAAEQDEYDRNTHKFNVYVNALNAEARALVKSSIKKGARVSLAVAIAIFDEHCAGKGTPLPADDPRQLEHWNEAQAGVKSNSLKTILIESNGEVWISRRVRDIKSRGTSADTEARRKEEGSAKKSVAFTGQDQKHALEGCAIGLLLALLKEFNLDEDWTFAPVFSSLQARVMVRHTSFAPNQWVPMQIKSAQIQFGRPTSYHLEKGKYEDWMYCIAVGMLDYTHNLAPASADDLRAEGARVHEIWDLGTCPDSLKPRPATPYDTVDASKRCVVSHAAPTLAPTTEFLAQILANLKSWPHRFPREMILFDTDVINKKTSSTQKVEMLGRQALAAVLPGLRSPWRQGETVDSVWETTNISNTTASISNSDPKQRRFTLAARKFDHFARWVVASYADEGHQKVAAIPASVVYGRGGAKTFCWNESKPEQMAEKQIRLFDLRTQAAELRAHLLS